CGPGPRCSATSSNGRSALRRPLPRSEDHPVQQLDDMAATILAAAVASGVDVERSYIAPGPDFARDCRAIVVHLDLLPIVPLPGSEFAGGCAFVAQPEWKVTFVADCVPAVDDQGRPPTAAAITAWSSAFLADVGAIHEALSALV